MKISTTLDGLLDRRVSLEQPETGYRVAMDTVFLAASVPALGGDSILDMGCGVGGAILCLAARVEGIRGTGIDIQPELIELFTNNIARNKFASGIEAYVGDVGELPFTLRGSFDHIMANPPYHEEKRHDASDNDIKRLAHIERPGDLEMWIRTAAQALKPFGTFTIIHRADRRDDILRHLEAEFGEAIILPLLSKEGGEAKRIIIRARKDSATPPRDYSHFVLHSENGAYTAAAEAILRSAQALPFQSP